MRSPPYSVFRFSKSTSRTSGGGESGIGAPYLTTTFQNTPGDPSGAIIHPDGPLYFQSGPIYLLVKDGAQTPAWYLFRITFNAAGGPWAGMGRKNWS